MSRRGRPKGSLNKLTHEAKQAIQLVFDLLGGAEAMVAWVKKDKANEFAFYTKIYPRLLPQPAPDAPPPAEAVTAVKGAFTWRTPDWARKAEKAQLRRGAARAAVPAPEAGVRSSGGAPPDKGDEE